MQRDTERDGEQAQRADRRFRLARFRPPDRGVIDTGLVRQAPLSVAVVQRGEAEGHRPCDLSPDRTWACGEAAGRGEHGYVVCVAVYRDSDVLRAVPGEADGAGLRDILMTAMEGKAARGAEEPLQERQEVI